MKKPSFWLQDIEILDRIDLEISSSQSASMHWKVLHRLWNKISNEQFYPMVGLVSYEINLLGQMCTSSIMQEYLGEGNEPFSDWLCNLLHMRKFLPSTLNQHKIACFCYIKPTKQVSVIIIVLFEEGNLILRSRWTYVSMGMNYKSLRSNKCSHITLIFYLILLQIVGNFLMSFVIPESESY